MMRRLPSLRSRAALRLIAGVCLLAVLAGCSGETGQKAAPPPREKPLAAVTAGLKSLLHIGRGRRTADPLPKISQQSLALTTTPLIEAHIPSIPAAARLVEMGRNAQVRTFMAPDRTSLSFRRGVLVATRGLAGDLLSADISGPVQAMAQGRAASYLRANHYLDGERHETVLRSRCTITPTGPARIEIVGRSLSTTLWQETCDNGVVNLYWLGRDSIIWKSHQWIGFDLGFLDTVVLKN